MEAKSIRNSIMLGTLSIGTWTGRKMAKEQARKIEVDAKAKSGTVSAVKHLFAGVTELEKVNKKATAIRVEWNRRTVPWFDSGPRAFNSAGYMDMMEWVRGERAEFKMLKDEFLKAYPSLRANRQFDLQDLFDEKEFPEPDDLKYKFYFSFSVDPVPNAQDIRILDGFDQEQVGKLVEKAEQRALSRAQAGVEAAAEKLYEVVQHMHGKLKVQPGMKGAEFRDSLVENIAALVPIMPTLNITNDPKLAALCEKAKELTLYSPDELRSNVEKRAEAAKKSKSLAKQLADMFADSEE